MMELLTAQQMRDLEKAAIQSGDVTGLELMERAGRGVVTAMLHHWSALGEGPRDAVVLCGPGNNGGDGFVIARVLAGQGWQVRVHLFGDPDKLPPDARVNHDRWAAQNAILPWPADAEACGETPDVIIDAVFGIGLTRALPQQILSVFDVMRKSAPNAVRVAVDGPSGLNLDTGEPVVMVPTTGGAQGANPRADLTVTFHLPKPGHYLGAGPSLCGALEVFDIGLQGFEPEQVDIAARVVSQRTTLRGAQSSEKSAWPHDLLPKLQGGGHKYDHGHVVVFAGGVGRGGAGRLAARAALRIGAGLVTLICPKAALIENAMQLNAVMLRGLDDPAKLAEVADHRVTGFCLGPGLGVGARTKSIVQAALMRATDGQPSVVVLDADALTSFEADPDALFAMVHARTILTPHAGEFARLFPDLALSLQQGFSKIEVVRRAAARAGCVVLLKGPDTVMADADGRTCLHAAVYGRAVPWLATAGAGDVLAGMIAGLAGSRLAAPLLVMAEAAVWLHVECARSFGPGLIAEDLPQELPKVLRSLTPQRKH